MVLSARYAPPAVSDHRRVFCRLFKVLPAASRRLFVISLKRRHCVPKSTNFSSFFSRTLTQSDASEGVSEDGSRKSSCLVADSATAGSGMDILCLHQRQECRVQTALHHAGKRRASAFERPYMCQAVESRRDRRSKSKHSCLVTFARA
jgi:hypothetical protein